LTAFFIAPWLAGEAGFLELPSGNPVDQWVMGNPWFNIMPAGAAMLAGLLFVMWGRLQARPSGAV
jgi:hypothetical protein